MRKKTRVEIDHDIPYDDYDTGYILRWIQKLPYDVLELYIRRSCGGNTHVALIVVGDLSPIDQMLIRAVMHDDKRRLRGDMERYLLDSPLFGLLFDAKYSSKTGIITRAGEWMEVTL